MFLMLELTDEQKKFLEKHNLNINTIFDAFWMKPKEYQTIMKELEIWIAIGVSPCEKEWHTMRTNAWHCLQCNPANIAFIKRWYEDAFVYVASSKSSSLLKVWFTKDTNKRKEKLNNNKYAWLNDWEMIYSAKYPKAGETEKRIHKELSDYRHRKIYNYCWKDMISYEIFNCSYSTIKRIFEKIKIELWESNIKDEREIRDAELIYNFPNIENNSKRI